MAKTYLDQIVDYPSKVILRISQDKQCVGFIVNKGFDKVTEEDMDVALEEHIMDYQYVDETTQETTAFVWVEMEVNQVANSKFKNTKLYVTVACHKNYMKLPRQIFKGISGNRRDNLVRYIDKVLNNSQIEPVFSGIMLSVILVSLTGRTITDNEHEKAYDKLHVLSLRKDNEKEI